MVQGLVSGMLDIALIEIHKVFADVHLVYPKHDAAILALPAFRFSYGLREFTIRTMKEIVERNWTIEGESFISTCGWSLRWPDGTKETI